jgi:glucose/mannose transport system permease protein
MRSKKIDKDTILAFLLVLPSIIAVFIFIYGFIFWSVRVSLSNWIGLMPNYEWAGLRNYFGLFQDPRFTLTSVIQSSLRCCLWVGACF